MPQCQGGAHRLRGSGRGHGVAQWLHERPAAAHPSRAFGPATARPLPGHCRLSNGGTVSDRRRRAPPRYSAPRTIAADGRSGARAATRKSTGGAANRATGRRLRAAPPPTATVATQPRSKARTALFSQPALTRAATVTAPPCEPRAEPRATRSSQPVPRQRRP